MEIKINKEICGYNEALFFGLSTRQFLCSVLAVAAAAGIYFGLKGIIGRETASWLCMVAAAPIAAMGFFRYNGLTAEKLLFAIIKSEILYAKRRVYKADNYYLDLLNMEPGKKVKICAKDLKKQHCKRKNAAESAKKHTGIYSNRKNIR